MKKKRNNTIHASGSILVLVLFVVLVSFIIGTGLLTLGTQSRVSSINRIREMAAQSAADAGLERAIQEINNAVIAGKWSSGVLPQAHDVSLPFTDSTYSVKTSYSAGSGYDIISFGRDTNRDRTVHAKLRLKGVFENAIQCRNDIILKSGTVIEAFDSRISMDPDDCDEKAVIGTNSINSDSIILNSGVEIDGDVIIGAGGDTNTVVKDLGATYDQSYSLGASMDFPSVTAPPLLGPDTRIGTKKGEVTIGPGGDFPANGRFSGITLGQGATLRVIGNCTLHLTGGVNMAQNSEIILDATKNAKLTVYLDGDWISDNGAGINNETTDPTTFSLYGTGSGTQQIDLKAKSEFYGVIYAPDADLTLFSGGNIYGSFVTNNFELKNPASFLYDVSLKKTSVSDEGARFVLNRWRER